jgi:hypothetical protein
MQQRMADHVAKIAKRDSAVQFQSFAILGVTGAIPV